MMPLHYVRYENIDACACSGNVLPVVCRHLGCSTAVLRKGSTGQMSIKSADERMSRRRGVGGLLGDWAGSGCVGEWAGGQVGTWARGGAGFND